MYKRRIAVRVVREQSVVVVVVKAARARARRLKRDPNFPRPHRPLPPHTTTTSARNSLISIQPCLLFSTSALIIAYTIPRSVLPFPAKALLNPTSASSRWPATFLTTLSLASSPIPTQQATPLRPRSLQAPRPKTRPPPTGRVQHRRATFRRPYPLPLATRSLRRRRKSQEAGLQTAPSQCIP